MFISPPRTFATEDANMRMTSGSRDLTTPCAKTLGIVKQVNVILQQIKTKFLNFEAAVGYTAHERMLEIAPPRSRALHRAVFGLFCCFSRWYPQ